MGSRLAGLYLVLVLLESCDLTSCDHPTNGAMQRELVEKSKRGLALARIESTSLELRFFDGRLETNDLKAESRMRRPRVGDPSISRNQIIMVEDPVDPVAHLDRPIPRLELQGGRVFILNAQGVIIDRSDVRVLAGIFALAPDNKQFAFVGALGGRTPSQGMYVASLHGIEIRKLWGLPPDWVHKLGERYNPLLSQPSLDWSPRGNTILFSEADVVLLIDVRTGRARKIVDGCGARWSPTGDRITYVTPHGQGFLLNVATGESKIIDPGKGVSRPIEWSPDGQYLLLAEGRGSHVLYGCLWVYRISDGAFVPIPYYGMAGALPYWISLPERN